MLALGYARIYTLQANRRWPAQGRILATRVGPIHILEGGPADAPDPPVVLVHGAAANARDLHLTLAPSLWALGLRTVAFDRQGAGHSPPGRSDPGDKGDRLALHAKGLVAVIDALMLERPVVVAHSYGGAVALRAGLDAPDALGGLVLLGAAAKGYVGPVSWYNYLAALPLIGPVVAHTLIPVLGPLVARDAAQDAFTPQDAPQDYDARTGLGLLFRPASFRANARDLARANRDLARQDTRYDTLETPLAIIAGTEDDTVWTARHSEPLAREARDARLAVMPGVGHQPQVADPAFVSEHVRALVESAALRTASTLALGERQG